MMAAAVIDQLNLGHAFIDSIRRFQIIENARPVRHSGECSGRPYRCDDGSGTSQSQHASEK
jgi:hypothetical protein